MRTRWLTFCLALPLVAGTSIRITAVERKGWPPFEDDRRIYRLEGEGAARLRPGEVLQLFRPGEPRNPGRLKVAFLEAGKAAAFLESRGPIYPLVGDLALSRRMIPIPALPAVAVLPDLSLRPPATAAPPESAKTPEATVVPASRHESIFFLEGDASLSPRGRDKLQSAVRAWGVEGRWILTMPENRVLPGKVRQNRIQAIRKTLVGLGVGTVEIKEGPRRPGDSGDVVYLAKG